MAIAQLKAQHPVAGSLTAWIILAVAFASDGTSWPKGMRQARRQAKEYELSVWRYILRSSDPVVRAVVLEDSAALIGVVVASARLFLSGILKTSVPDSLASLAMGLLLAVTAFGWARPFADFAVGRSALQPVFEKLHTIFREDGAVEQLPSLRAIYSGPEEVVVMAKVRPSAKMNIEKLARAMDDLDRNIRGGAPSGCGCLHRHHGNPHSRTFSNSIGK